MVNRNKLALTRRLLAVISALLILNSGSHCRADEVAPKDDLRDAAREFSLKVFPLLKSKCFACHGEDEAELKGDLDLRTREAMLVGGESGDASLVPGEPDESPLYQAVMWDGLEMPPKENDRLTEEQTELVRRWIKNGAPWPSAADQETFRIDERKVRQNDEGMIVDTSGGTSEEWTYRRYQADDLWAWRPVAGKNAWAKEIAADENPVDHFIHRKRKTAGFAPAQKATPATLIRRATFDLIGLPPTPAEIADFQIAWDQDAQLAWSKLIDRLLASPQYGERWAQHWLDVTRYADTGGMSNDYERSNMWRYRDYVIRSLNADKPYDQFVVEQLAGDELADQSVLNRHDGDESKVVAAQLAGDYNEEEAEWIVATGFLRLGPWDNAMVEEHEARHIYLDDVVNVVGQTFLSTTMRCVKCHDHKFDPIPTRDYYRMYAALSTTQMAERPAPLLPNENRAGFESGKKHVQKMLDFAVAEKNKLVAKREAAARAWFEERDLEYIKHKDRKELPDEEKPPRHVGLDHVEQGQLKVREQDEWIWNRRLERYEPMAQSVYNAGKVALAWNGARKLRIDEKADRKTAPAAYILTGGALTALGDEVSPGVLSATMLHVATQPQEASVSKDSVGEPEEASTNEASDGPPPKKEAVGEQTPDDPYLLPDTMDGRRLGLARWIAHPDNPLTARSIVNRVWQYHFGRGIARNPNNFGGKGGKPTHPELLDYLAADFVEKGWTLKRLHRMLMMSETYQQSAMNSTLDTDGKSLAEKDPNNELWAYFPQRRMTSEELRDAMLFATGELDLTAGGLPIMPEINMEVALQPRMIQFSIAPAYQPSPTPEVRNRRTVYAYRTRGQADPLLELFNKPNPNDSCELRDTAAVTPQVFTLLNSDVVTDRSIAMAVRLQSDSSGLTEQINEAYLRILGREATTQERERLAGYVGEMIDYHAQVEVESVTFPTTITRSLVEELSGKPFEYEEILPIFEAYKPDTKPADVSAETRALADMCLLLFNTNEFIFLR